VGAPDHVCVSSLVKKLTLPSGAQITKAYDVAARLLSTTLKNSGHSTFNSHAYQLSSHG
jgi:hypothetical protein